MGVFFFFLIPPYGFLSVAISSLLISDTITLPGRGMGRGEGEARYYILSTRMHSERKTTKQPQCMRWMETIQPAHSNYIIKKKGGVGWKKNLLAPLPPLFPPRGLAEIFLNYRLFQ